MADPTPDDLTFLRKLIQDELPEVGDPVYSDAFLTYVVNHAGDNLYGAASDIWTIKAGEYAALVDQTESGSTKNLSQMHRQAVAQSDLYGRMAGGTGADEDPLSARVMSLRRVAGDPEHNWPPTI